MDCAGQSQEDPIEGIETPDDSTIVFHLERPTGDILYRLAQPAAAPVPPEVAGCFDEAGEYGRYVMSNGPYMLLGSDGLDASSCDTLEPISGYDPDRFMYAVRNPSYDQATDDQRQNYVDGFSFVVNTNKDDIYSRVLTGDVDIVHGEVPAAFLQQYLTNPELEDNLRVDRADVTWYISMNLLVPPFDDVHVRRAVNLAVDKAALLQAAGGPTAGLVATTIEPPGVLPDTASYDPYPSPDFAGDLDAAMAEMAQSRYDSDGDGVCDDPACRDLVAISVNVHPWAGYTPILQADLSQIGIEPKIRELNISAAYSTIQTAGNLVPIAIHPGWGKDYASPYGFDFFLFNSAGIACEGTVNYSNVGMTQGQAARCGDAVLEAYTAAVEANGSIPSVDGDMAICVGTPPGDAYEACWAAIDRRLMEEIVPWVPYRWASQNTVLGDPVVEWAYDQSASWTAYSRVAVDNDLTMEEVAG
jgi:peptide/nickel transport system substrate-binding protein